ncbi:ubiquinol-cytochrome c reductase complex assembly factor 2 isoform X1 [Desmodus rotundus]|uniref:ubiquinol-cytochrome c reductase complex assembly factor 2 isoform X1 n=1 Tax=Desmodus rotundus TaxID=9430 RepID=UPI00238140F7|nr:ubiquinol-cytochrome-c reductase complex assembly factor 2 isoform X1 [Desmodus rotundus]
MASGRHQTGPRLGRLPSAAGSAGLSGGRKHPELAGDDAKLRPRPWTPLALGTSTLWVLGACLCSLQANTALQIAEPEACEQMYQSLARIHSNYYKHKYPRPRDTSFSGLSLEEYRLILSTDTLEELKEMNKGMWKRLQEKFASRSPEEQHKAWAQPLSRPRT